VLTPEQARGEVVQVSPPGEPFMGGAGGLVVDVPEPFVRADRQVRQHI